MSIINDNNTKQQQQSNEQDHKVSLSHQDKVLDMALIDDVLVTCGRDGLVKVWK